MKRFFFSLLVFLLLCTYINVALADDVEYFEPAGPDTKIHGTVDMNYTYDTRDMNRVTLNTLVFFPYRISYYGFFHLNSPMATSGQNFEISTFYHEQDLWWNTYEALPLDAAFQWQVNPGTGNDLARFGARWRISDTPWVQSYFEKAHLFVTTQLHALQTDFNPTPGWGISMEHFFRWDVLPERFDNRVYMSGFMDHNMDWGGASGTNHHNFVFEVQTGFRFYGNWNAIIEYRYSDYDVKRQGVGLGVEYVVNF